MPVPMCHRPIELVIRGELPTCIIRLVETKAGLSKHERIRQTLTDAIASGQYEPGQRLPSESELGQDVRRVAPDRQPGAARTAALRRHRPARRVGQLRARGRGGARLRVRTAHSRAGPHRNLRADLPRHGRSAARQPPRAALGQLAGRRRQRRGAGVAGLPAARGQEGVGRLLRAAGADAARRTRSTAASPTSSTGRHSRRAARSRPRRLSGAQPLRPGRHRQSPRRLHASPRICCSAAAAGSCSSAVPARRRPWTPASAATGRR